MNAMRSGFTLTAGLLLFMGCGLTLDPAPLSPCTARVQSETALSESVAAEYGPAWTDEESTYEVSWSRARPRHVEVWKTSREGATERVASVDLSTEAPLTSCSPAIETANGRSWAMCSAAECLLLEYRTGAIMTPLRIAASGHYPRLSRWDDVIILDTEGDVAVIKGGDTQFVRYLGSHTRAWVAHGKVAFGRGNSLCRLRLSDGEENCQFWPGKIRSGMSWDRTEVVASRGVLGRERLDVLDQEGRRIHSWAWPRAPLEMIAARSRGFAWRSGETTVYAIERDRVRTMQVGVPVDWIAEVTSDTRIRIRSGARLLDLELKCD